MKTNLFIFLILLCIGAKNYAQNVNIPDANFKSYLVGNTTINTNGDSEIQVSEASAYTGIIDVSYLGINDLTGIAAFTQIVKLDCSSNQLSSLDVSSNIALKTLLCGFNQLTFLNVSNCVVLIYLSCDSNQLTSLDVTNNIALQNLGCSLNQLTILDVSNNIALQYLSCAWNQLTSLSTTNNIALYDLNCGYTQLTSLDVSNCNALQILNCSGNQLTSLDVSTNTTLESLNCEANQLAYLDISNNTVLIGLNCNKNQLASLDISNNTALQYLYCIKNSNLSCIQVWNTIYANSNWKVINNNIDSTMYFSLDCNYTSTAENLASALSILPNPASDYLYISYEGEKKLSFAISDIWGKTLAAWEAHSAGAFYEKEVPIADFPVGIYFLSVQAGDKKVVKKFVKE